MPPEDGPRDYPAHWAADVVLRDGSTLHIRPVRPSDAPALERFHRRQSPESVYFRFFAARPVLTEAELVRLTQVDHRARVALVLVSGADVVGVGRYDRVEDDVAEVAFHVADPWQGRGLGSVLLEHLAAAARERGIARFVADVLPGNVRMLRVFRDAGYELRQRYEDGVVSVAFDIAPTQRSLAVMAEREQHADAQSMRAILGATSVLVVAEGREEGARGRRVAENVLDSPFRGPVHLVGAVLHPVAARGEERGRPDLRSHTDLSTVDEAVDLALLAAPGQRLPALIRSLEPLRVRGVVLLSEAGSASDEVLRAAREVGARLVGPESFGVLAHGAAGRLDATLAVDVPASGGFSLFCQSAAAGLSLLAAAREGGLGVRTFLSAGQRADVSGNDAMQLWIDDEETDVVAVSLESIGNPRKFSRVARRLAARVPVVAVVSGRTGQAVPPGHRVRTSPQPRRVLDELLRQAGVIRVASTREMLDVVQLLDSQPLPHGERVAVLAGSPSLAGHVAEVLRAQDLVPGPLVVVGPGAPPESWGRSLAAGAATPGPSAGPAEEQPHAVVVAYAPLLDDVDPAVLTALATAAAGSPLPVLALVPGLRGLRTSLSVLRDGRRRTVPAFEAAEDLARALRAALDHSRGRSRVAGRALRPTGVDQRAAQAPVERLAADVAPGEERELPAADVMRLLHAYGIRLWPTVVVGDLAGARAAGGRLGWPVAVKSDDERLRHRLDLGGVRLDVDEGDLAAALAQLDAAARSAGLAPGRYQVQAMAPRGVACVVRAVEDDLYGPVVSFGLAGDAVELLEDVTYAFPPVTADDVASMVRSVRAAPRLLGHRGLPPLDLVALEDVVGRVTMLKDDLPQVVRLVLHPVLAAERGAAVLEARAWIGAPARLDRGRRVLPG